MVTLVPRRPPHGDVMDIPTPPLQRTALFINFFFPALALVTYLLRVFIRVRMRQWGADDWCISLAMLCSALMCGPFFMHIKLNYFGWHAVDVPDFDPSPGMWWFYIAQIFYNPVLAFVKASVLFFLHRLGGTKPGVHYAIWTVFTINALQAIAIFLVAVLQCLPISANWDMAVRMDADTKCVQNSFHISISCLTIFTDLLVLGLPIWMFVGLKMRVAQKIAVIGVFMLGIAVTIVAIIRLRDMYAILYKPPPPDPYHNIGITLNTVEVNIAIICATIPALRPLFRAWLPTWFGGSSAKPYGWGSSRKYGYGNNNKSGDGQSKSGNNNGQLQRSGTIGGGGGEGNGARSSIGMKNLGVRNHHTECRSDSPHGSEEEIMTYHGIMKSTQVQVQFDGATLGSERGHDHEGVDDGGESGDRGLGEYEFSQTPRVSSDLEMEKRPRAAGL